MKVRPWPAERAVAAGPLHVFFIYSSMMFTSSWEIEVATSGTDFYYPWVLLYSWLSTGKKSFLLIVSEEERGYGNRHWKDMAVLAISQDGCQQCRKWPKWSTLSPSFVLVFVMLSSACQPFIPLHEHSYAHIHKHMYASFVLCMHKCCAHLCTIYARFRGWTVCTFIGPCCITGN